ncbi:unnamed protein product [Wickerhamomyces anomalus]
MNTRARQRNSHVQRGTGLESRGGNTTFGVMIGILEAHLEKFTALDLLYDSIQQIAAFMTGIFLIKEQLNDRYIYQDLTSSLYYAGSSKFV